MRMTSAIGNIIREGKTHLLYGAIESGSKHGMISMDQYLAFLIKQKLITLEDAKAAAHDPTMVAKLAEMEAPTQG